MIRMLNLFKKVEKVILLCVLVLLVVSFIPRLQASTITEWTIPTDSSGPDGIVVWGSQVYFTEEGGNKIGR